MNELRWILLGVGVVLLALIYLFARRNGVDDNSLPAQDARFEPSLSAEDRTDDAQFDETDDAIDDAVISATAASRFDANDEPRSSASNFSSASKTPALGALDDDASGSPYTSTSDSGASASSPDHQSTGRGDNSKRHSY